MPIFARNGSCSRSCRAPPMNTAQASASTGGSKRSAKKAAPMMNERLSSTGVNAGTAKRLQVLSTPAASATREMKTMYGKVMRSICAVSANFSGSPAKPGAVRYTISGAAAMPSAAVTRSATKSTVETQSTSARVSSGDCLLRYSARIGTKACEKAPSPNRRRRRFGMRKATKKASVASPAPKILAMKKSRTKPSTLETSVKLLTVARARRRFMLEFAPFFDPVIHGQHQIRPQARTPGDHAAQPQPEPAHRRAQRDQDRPEGDPGRRQEGRRRCARALAGGDRTRRRQRRAASERRGAPQEPPRPRHQGDALAG